MKRRLMVALLALCMALGMSPGMALAMENIARSEQKTVHAGTPMELRNAIQSNTKIILEGKAYVIERGSWTEKAALTIRNIENLTIEGTEKTQILTPDGAVLVVSIINSQNVTIKGVEMGHQKPTGCDEGVLNVENSSSVTIENCDLFGCGREGLSFSASTITAAGTTIRDCSENIMDAYSGQASFENCSFLRNGSGPDAIDVTNRQDDLSITFLNCEFRSNRNSRLVDKSADVTFDDCVFENNKWPNDSSSSGTCGANLTWTLDNGVMMIRGTGSMGQMATSVTDRWNGYSAQIESIVIEEGVTSIYHNAFAGCIALTSVTIPSSVTSIGSRAFEDCTSLTSITIPNGVTQIDGFTFSDCKSLTSISIPDSITCIGNYAFSGCSSLKSTTIPSGVNEIGDGAFTDCSSLQSITIPVGVTNIGDDTFFRCSSLQSVTIPDSVTSIDRSAFCACTALTSITIPDSVTSIGPSAFSLCSCLKRINIPSGVTSIGNSAFSSCESLASIAIPDGVTDISSTTFSSCRNLTSVSIPSSVTNIAFAAFDYCNNLKDIYYSGTAVQWKEIGIQSHNDALENAKIHYNSTPTTENQPGDLTGDGKVTMADVLRLARGAAGYVTLTEQEQKAGDVTGDGKITMADVIRVARSAAGYNPTL